MRRVYDPLEMEEFDGEGPDPRFANEGSALRTASAQNPRIHPCPTCKAPNRLTPADVARGYQCDACADRDERGGF
jgi:hypothetical protein